MNNSFDRLIDGMIKTLRQDVIPHTDTVFARGQAFGVIYMLESIRRRGGWSAQFFATQIALLDALKAEIAPRLAGTGAPPLPETQTAGHVAAADLQALFEAAQTRVCALLEWTFAHPRRDSDEDLIAVRRALNRYAQDQIRFEIESSARPMFAQISSGTE